MGIDHAVRRGLHAGERDHIAALSLLLIGSLLALLGLLLILLGLIGAGLLLLSLILGLLIGLLLILLSLIGARLLHLLLLRLILGLLIGLLLVLLGLIGARLLHLLLLGLILRLQLSLIGLGFLLSLQLCLAGGFCLQLCTATVGLPAAILLVAVVEGIHHLTVLGIHIILKAGIHLLLRAAAPDKLIALIGQPAADLAKHTQSSNLPKPFTASKVDTARCRSVPLLRPPGQRWRNRRTFPWTIPASPHRPQPPAGAVQTDGASP